MNKEIQMLAHEQVHPGCLSSRTRTRNQESHAIPPYGDCHSFLAKEQSLQSSSVLWQVLTTQLGAITSVLDKKLR